MVNEHMQWELPLWAQAVLGGLAITAGELATGAVLNLWLGLGIWDYSDQWGNLLGQICPLYAALWCLLAGPVIVGFDWLDYWLCGGERPRYLLFQPFKPVILATIPAMTPAQSGQQRAFAQYQPPNVSPEVQM